MEKLIYALWAHEGETRANLNHRIQRETGPALLAQPTLHGLRFNLQDDAVARAEGLRMRCPGAEQPDAVIQLWLDNAHEPFRAPVDTILNAVSRRLAAWSVVESTIIPNNAHPGGAHARTWGWSQVCFLKRPERLDHQSWRHNWQALHTQVAIETQANFEYVQNLVVRPLIDGPHEYAAIVEECFPPGAMDDPHAFFDAIGDAARFEANTRAMAASCARFIDEGGVDLLPTSQYDLKRPG